MRKNVTILAMKLQQHSLWAKLDRWINKHPLIRFCWHSFLIMSKHLWFTILDFWSYLRFKSKKLQIFHDRILDYLNKHKSMLAFLKAAIVNPGATGAVLPSSKWLARTMASYIDGFDNRLIVELGPGTGVITQAMLDRGIAPQQIIAIEYEPHLAKALQERFPKITVIHGDATSLKEFLKHQTQAVHTIISGLPLRRLPQETLSKILSAIPAVLDKQGQFIQFTYDIRRDKDFYPKCYHLAKSTIVWRNIPPARVSMYHF